MVTGKLESCSRPCQGRCQPSLLSTNTFFYSGEGNKKEGKYCQLNDVGFPKCGLKRPKSWNIVLVQNLEEIKTAASSMKDYGGGGTCILGSDTTLGYIWLNSSFHRSRD